MNDWTVICNNSLFDIESYLKKEGGIVWRQLKNCQPGDLVFFYLAAPFSSIRYVCKVEEIDIRDPKRILPFYLNSKYEYGYTEKTNCAYMYLSLIRKIDDPRLYRPALLENGMNSFQKGCMAPNRLSKHLHSVLDSYEGV